MPHIMYHKTNRFNNTLDPWIFSGIEFVGFQTVNVAALQETEEEAVSRVARAALIEHARALINKSRALRKCESERVLQIKIRLPMDRISCHCEKNAKREINFLASKVFSIIIGFFVVLKNLALSAQLYIRSLNERINSSVRNHRNSDFSIS